MPHELRFLTKSETKIVDAIVRAAYPLDRLLKDKTDESLDPAHIGVAQHFDTLLSRVARPARWFMRTYLHFFNWLPILTLKHFKKLVYLTPEQAEDFLISRYKSKNYISRGGATLIKTLIGMSYYSRPKIMKALGVELSCESGNAKNVEWGEKPIGFANIARDIEDSCDVCVVGSGAGGGVLAGELAELGKRVIVVEEGPYVPPSEYKPEWGESLQQLYRQNGLMTSVGKPVIPVQSGRCLGGTTVINAAICFRLPKNTLKDWQNDYGVELKYSELVPSFERVEKKAHVKPVDPECLGNNNLLFKRGCDALGISSNPIKRNEIGCKACAVCTNGCPEGAKQSTDIAYLPKATKNGARIYVNSRVEKILVSGYETKGVVASVLDPLDRPTHKLHVRAKAVVLCASALYTPIILLRNGLVKSSPNVGRNFINQVGCGLVGIFEDDVNMMYGANQGYESSEYAEQNVILETVTGEPAMVQLRAGGVGLEHVKYMLDYRKMAFFGALIKTTSRGVLKTQPNVWEPLIFYSLNDVDMKRLKFGLEKVAEVLFAAGAKKLVTGIHGLPTDLTRPEDVKIIRDAEINNTHLNVIGNHPLGTCMMGDDKKRAVISGLKENLLEVFDVKNLYVCDGSIFPTALGVNPQLTIMAFADLLAHRLADRL